MKVTWHDLNNAPVQELKKKYRMNDQQMEQQVRRHLDGASPQERRDMYKTVWDKKR